jgi:hypothetical protein
VEGYSVSQGKRLQIEERLRMIEERLSNAEEYIAKGVNVEGLSFLHLGDWHGKSGHPLWMKNYLIPSTLKQRARTERKLEGIVIKEKAKVISMRRRRGAR